MKKIVLLFVLLFLSGLILACSSDDTSDKNTDDSDKSGDTDMDTDTDTAKYDDSASGSAAKEETGSISGVFILEGEDDYSGIAVTISDTSLTATTAADGCWRIVDVPVGNYEVRATKEPWEEVVVSGQKVEAGEETSVEDVQLTLDGTLYLRYVFGGSVNGDIVQTGVVDMPLATSFTVEVVDALGNGVADVEVTFTVTAGGGSLSDETVKTNSTGVAAATLTLGEIVGVNTVVVSSTETSTQTVTFNADAVAGVASRLEASSFAGSGTVGKVTPEPVTVTLFDEFDNIVPNAEVIFSTEDGELSASSVKTDADGVATVEWTLDTVLDTDGEQQLNATVTGTILEHTFNIGNVADVPVSLVKVSGDGQINTVGYQLENPLVVKVEDKYKNPTKGWSINWTSEDGTVTPSMTLVDVTGHAQVSVQLGNDEGEQSFVASLDSQSVTFTATASLPMSHEIVYIWPGVVWPGYPLDLDITVEGDGFLDDAKVIWDAGGSAEQDLTTVYEDGKTLTATIPSALFPTVPATINITVEQGDDDEQCATYALVVGPTLPDTGQLTSSDTVTGEDAEYGWDAMGITSSMRFTRTDEVNNIDPGIVEPIVYDAVTQLTWQGCPSGKSGSTCGDGTELSQTWEDAATTCEDLEWGGHDDWYLPSVRQLATIISGEHVNPNADSNLFPEVLNSGYWSSTPLVNDNKAWTMTHYWGTISWDTRDELNTVRCVRGVAEPEQALKRIAGTHPVVVDASTGLMWQGCEAGREGDDCATGTSTAMNWGGALDYCTALSWNGYTDWVIPDRNQLQSIVMHSSVDNNTLGPAYDATAFPNITTSKGVTWTSTLSGALIFAIFSNYGNVYSSSTGDTYYHHTVRCVRGVPGP